MSTTTATTATTNLRDEQLGALAAALATLHPRTAARLDQLIHSGTYHLDTFTAAEYQHEDGHVAGTLRLPWMERGAELRLIVSNGRWTLRYRPDAWARSRDMTITRALGNCEG